MGMKKHTLALVASLATALISGNALAQDKAQGSGPSPFTECGIGAALFSETPWAAASSNIIWDVGSTAVTSATMSPETCNPKKKEVAQYIIDTYENVVEETAIGEGEYLNTMLNIYGCEQSAHDAIISDVRADFGAKVSEKAYSDLDSVGKAESYYFSLTEVIDNNYSANCAA